MVPKNNQRERLHITLPVDVYRALETRREFERLGRSEAMAQAVRAWVSDKDSEEMDRRGRVTEKIEASQDYLEELLRGQVERIAKMVYRAHVSSEALLIHAADGDESRTRMKRAAAQVIGTDSSAERKRGKESE